MKTKFIFLMFFVAFCASYQTEFEDQAVREHQEFFGLEFSNDPSDVSSIIIKIKTECKEVENDLRVHNDKNLDLEGVIDNHYILLRKTEKSHLEKEDGSRETLNKLPEEVEKYMKAIYKYCNLEDILNENWKDLEIREKSFIENS